MNQIWQDELYKIAMFFKKACKNKDQKPLVKELEARTNDLDTIKKVLNGEEPESALQDLLDNAQNRHKKQDPNVNQNPNDPAIISDPNAIEDNKKWDDLLNNFVNNPPSQRGLKQLQDANKIYLDELNGRTGDMDGVKDISDKKKDDAIAQPVVEDTKNKLIKNVENRHNDEEKALQDTFPNNDDIKDENIINANAKELNDFKDNDRNWRRELDELTSAIVEQKDQPDWWLRLDENRNKHVDQIMVDQSERTKLNIDGVYLNRVLPEQKNENTDNYVPIEPVDKFRMINTLYDASEVCDFVAIVAPEYMDTRVIERPANANDPYPLTNVQVEDNAKLLLNTCKAMGVKLPSYQYKSWINPTSHAPLLCAVLEMLHDKHLKKYVNLERHPEIIRLLTKNELNDDPEKIRNGLEPKDVLKRWMNGCLGRKFNEPSKNFAKDLYDTLRKLDKKFDQKAPPLNYGMMNDKAAKHLLDYAKNDLGIKTNIEPQDLVDGNIKLEELLAAKIFDVKNGLSPLNDQERKKYRAFWSDDNPDDDAFLPWLNSMLPPHLQISNLYRDLADGIVLAKILEACKPGCIKWKKMREKCRHKFDKVNNCNYVTDVMKKDFGFSLVGIGGSDITDGTQKYIHTILWQIMRFHATKALSDLSFGGKMVKDEDILKWAKSTHSKLAGDRRVKPPKNFSDRSLTTAVFYIELIKVLDSALVKDEYVHYDLEPMAHTAKLDKKGKERLDNARYAIANIRKLGGELFVMPEDLICMEPKAVLSVFAALMTIGYTEAKNRKAKKMDQKHAQQMENALYGQDNVAG